MRFTHVPSTLTAGQAAPKPLSPGRPVGVSAPAKAPARPSVGTPAVARDHRARVYPDVTPSTIGIAASYPTVHPPARAGGPGTRLGPSPVPYGAKDPCTCHEELPRSGPVASQESFLLSRLNSPVALCRCPPGYWSRTRPATDEERACFRDVVIGANSATQDIWSSIHESCPNPLDRWGEFIDSWLTAFRRLVAAGPCGQGLLECQTSEIFGRLLVPILISGCGFAEELLRPNTYEPHIDDALEGLAIIECVPFVFYPARPLYQGVLRPPPNPPLANVRPPVRRF